MAEILRAEGPRPRGRPPSSSEAAIVEVALRLVKDSGIAGLSMRALARELGIPVMTLYSYVPNVEALQRLVIEHLLREISVPEASGGTWEEQLRQVMRDARSVFTANPGLVGNLSVGTTAEGIRLAEGVLRILHEGGFGPEQAVLSFTALYTFMTGQIDIDAMSGAVVSRSPTATLGGVRQSTGFSEDELFEFGLDALVEGLKLRLLTEKECGD